MELRATETRHVASSADVLKPGDYCYIEKRLAIKTYEIVTAEPPEGRFKRLWWALFGTKETTKVTELPQWPDYDCIVMGCPHCGQPIGSTKEHEISSVEPLTLDKPLACAYSKPSKNSPPAVAFLVKDGQIMPVT